MNAIYIILNINLFLTTLNLLFMSTDSIYYHLCYYVIQFLKYIMLMSICSSVLFMFGNENKLKLET